MCKNKCHDDHVFLQPPLGEVFVEIITSLGLLKNDRVLLISALNDLFQMITENNMVTFMLTYAG